MTKYLSIVSHVFSHTPTVADPAVGSFDRTVDNEVLLRSELKKKCMPSKVTLDTFLTSIMKNSLT